MEKLGVQFEDQQVKTAASGKRQTHCPDCGEELIENNQFIMWCSRCGTKPFEKKPAESK